MVSLPTRASLPCTARLMRAQVLCGGLCFLTLLSTLSACSFIGVRSVVSDRIDEPCTTSNADPVSDVLIGLTWAGMTALMVHATIEDRVSGIETLTIPLATVSGAMTALHVGSASWGFNETSKCRTLFREQRRPIPEATGGCNPLAEHTLGGVLIAAVACGVHAAVVAGTSRSASVSSSKEAPRAVASRATDSSQEGDNRSAARAHQRMPSQSTTAGTLTVTRLKVPPARLKPARLKPAHLKPAHLKPSSEDEGQQLETVASEDDCTRPGARIVARCVDGTFSCAAPPAEACQTRGGVYERFE